MARCRRRAAITLYETPPRPAARGDPIGGAAAPGAIAGPPIPPTREPFHELCRYAAQLVTPPPGIDAAALFAALGAVESSSGRQLGPLCGAAAYEPAGAYYHSDLEQRWGGSAACSFGPWQIVGANAATLRPDITPRQLFHDSRLAAELSAEHLQRRVIDRGARTVAEIADAWNSGSHRDSFVPHAYIAAVQAAYDERN